jgi:polysaccharide pyruvyl transferase WcaK-like protein
MMLTKLAAFGPRALTLGLSHRHPADSFVLMAPSVEGSRGDAAMMEVLLSDLRRSYSGRSVLLCYRRTERHADLVRQFGVEVESLERLARNPLHFRQLLNRTHTFRLIGADIVDGFYSPLTTLLRLSAAQTFAYAGCDARIISFSFCATPAPSVAELWRRLPPSLGLLVRDPESQRRLSALLGREVQQAADLAFLLESDDTGTEEHLHWIAAEQARGQRVVGIGVNALLVDAAGRRALARVLANLATRDQHLSLLLVSHDFRAKSSDLEAARDTLSHLPRELLPRVSVIAREYGPRQLKAIAKRLDAVVSGRMHFSIAALSQGVPAFCFRYQGKVEGLLELVGLARELDAVSIDSGSLEPQWELVAERVHAFLQRRQDLARGISARLEQLRALSALNLQHPRLDSRAAAKPLGASAPI